MEAAEASSSDRTDDQRGLATPRAPPRMWASVAGAWGEHAAYVDARGAAVTREDARAARCPGRASACSSWPAGRADPGSRPPGGSPPGARWSCPTWRREMTAIAAARAEALGLDNVTTRDAGPRGDRRARRLLRRRAVPRGAACSRPTPRRAARRDPARPAPRRAGRAGGLGPARAQPVARASCSTR